MKYVELECGIHEALRLISPCPVCSAIPPPERFVNRQREALRMFREGLTRTQIALALDISPNHAHSLVADALGRRPKNWMYSDCISERERK